MEENEENFSDNLPHMLEQSHVITISTDLNENNQKKHGNNSLPAINIPTNIIQNDCHSENLNSDQLGQYLQKREGRYI